MLTISAKASPVYPPKVPKQTFGNFAHQASSLLYTALILVVAFGAGVYSVRKNGIFSCSASGYAPNRYLSYCNVTGYGDYDHGAIWFGLEPAATAAAANARVLFLGNSRTQFAFSSKATADWFSLLRETYYLLGFSHSENYTFEMPLLRKLHPKAKVYVINIDSFFDRLETGPGKAVMRDESASNRYAQKCQWQRIHEAICRTFNDVCGNEGAFFRSRSTGAWLVTGGPFPSERVSYDEDVDRQKLASYTASAKGLLPSLSADPACLILTIVPSVKTDLGTAKAIAGALGSKLVAPKLTGLITFDRVHLNLESAQRWSNAFLEEAGPQIRKCLKD